MKKEIWCIKCNDNFVNRYCIKQDGSKKLLVTYNVLDPNVRMYGKEEDAIKPYNELKIIFEKLEIKENLSLELVDFNNEFLNYKNYITDIHNSTIHISEIS
jgi:hypothetical protein